MSGTALAQGLLFLATPFLTRIFGPDDFGMFAVFTAIVAPVVSVASWKYELAIMLPEKEEDGEALLFLSLGITLFMSLLSALLVFLFKGLLLRYIDSAWGDFIWLVPAGVLVSGLFQSFLSFSSRKKFFRQISYSKVNRAGTAIGLQSAAGLYSLFSSGLIIGKIMGDFTGFLHLLWIHIRRGQLHWKNTSRRRIMVNAKRYENFPKYQSFAGFLNSLSQNIPGLLLAFFYSPAIAGFYALTSRIMGAPITLIGQSTREVYYQKASRMYARGESIRSLFKQTTMGLVKLGIGPFVIVGVFAQPIFTHLLGDESWLISGIYAQIVIVWLFFSFINTPATATLYILQQQKFLLKYEMALSVFRILSLSAGYFLFNNHFLSIGLYALTGAVFNLILIIYSYKISGQSLRHRPANKIES